MTVPYALDHVAPIDFSGSFVQPSALRRVGGADAEAPRLVVLYDRDCGLCTASVRRLRRWDRAGRLEMLALQEAGTDARPGIARAVRGLPLSTLLHVVDERTGEVRAGGAAALTIGAELPGGRVVRAISTIPPFRWAVGVGYGLIARNRQVIGRWLRLEGPACDVAR